MITINHLTSSSKNVILSCSKSNGAIVSSNAKTKKSSEQVQNYRYVSPRDAAFACYAAKFVDLEIQENFFKWCTLAQDWDKTGLFYDKYKSNGNKIGEALQPDQTGTVLWVACDYYKNHQPKHPITLEKLIKESAEGIRKIWVNNCFKNITQDIWQERNAFADLHEVFIYSLAACAKGLIMAQELFHNEAWRSTAHQMLDVLDDVESARFYRLHGYITDKSIDASLLGLVWPFDVVGKANIKVEKSVSNICKNLVKRKGVYRYENDEYDGWMYNNKMQRRKGAGYWPLLNFWMAIVMKEYQQIDEANAYLQKVLNDLEDNLIPEQIFTNVYQQSVAPFTWAHAMFIIAVNKLGLANKD